MAAYPLEIVRIRLIQQRLSNIQYYGTLDGAVKISKREGLAVLVQGILPAIACCHTIRWTSHVVSSVAAGFILNHLPTSVLFQTHLHRMLSSLLAAAVWFPFDSALKKTQASSSVITDDYMKPNYFGSSYFRTLKLMWAAGPLVMYRGFSTFFWKSVATALISTTSIHFCQNYWLWVNGYTRSPTDASPLPGVPQQLTPSQLRHYEWEQQRLPLYRFRDQEEAPA